MSGLVRIVWTLYGEVIKDQTVPYEHGAIAGIGDAGEIDGPLGKAPITVNFHFDPPLAPISNQEADDGRS